MSEISAQTPDWGREAPARYWDPARRLLRTIRDYQAAGSGPGGGLRRRWAVLRHRFWSVVTQAEIDLNAVVLCDVPAGAVAVGVPARILEGGT